MIFIIIKNIYQVHIVCYVTKKTIFETKASSKCTL